MSATDGWGRQQPMGRSEVYVVAAAVVNEAGEVLVARRPADRHQGGLLEFPGGKVEPGENPRSALARELEEELGIQPTRMRPLIEVRHDYPERSVRLEVWRVGGYRGEPYGREGQPLAWLAPAAMAARHFPAADRPILTALRLPSCYLITGPHADEEDLLGRLTRALARGVRLVQLRAPGVGAEALAARAKAALRLCRAQGASLLLNAPPALVESVGADGVHLTSRALMACTRRPLDDARWVGASCHDAAELAHAARLGADFAVLGPVCATASHPGAAPLGWTAFAGLAKAAAMPVYALGGVGPADLERAHAHGAQGIAAISALWVPPARQHRG